MRFWEERGEKPDASVWRFSLEDPHTGQRRGFASLEALIAALTEEMEGRSDGESQGDLGQEHEKHY